jgi:hypothetical protein
MGVFDKLAFWKKDQNLGKDFGADLGLGNMNQGPDFGFPPQQGQHGNMGLDQNMNLGMPDDMGFGNIGSGPQAPPGQPSSMQQPFGSPLQPQQPMQSDYKSDKFEVVSAKLDSIRYTLESINQRLANLERVAYGEQEKKKGW